MSKSWLREHERELDTAVSEVIIYNVSYLISDMSKHDAYMDSVMELECRYNDNFYNDGGELEVSEVFEYWIVADWFARELKQRGEVIDMDFYGLTIWGRCTTGQAISMDWIVQDILKDIVESRKKYS